MSTGTSTGSPSWADYDYEGSHGEGWVIFAGIMIAIAGVMNFIYGIAAIGNSHFFLANEHYVISDLSTWGWVVMLLGVFELCVALGIWVRAGWARWTGVVMAGLNAIAQLIFLPSYPLLALTIFTLDILVIYGLVTYGGREPAGT
jgi:hypothetical protein